MDDDLDDESLLRLRKRVLEKQIDNAKLHLDGACSNTTDPKVANAYGFLMALRVEHDFYNDRKKRGDQLSWLGIK